MAGMPRSRECDPARAVIRDGLTGAETPSYPPPGASLDGRASRGVSGIEKGTRSEGLLVLPAVQRVAAGTGGMGFQRGCLSLSRGLHHGPCQPEADRHRGGHRID